MLSSGTTSSILFVVAVGMRTENVPSTRVILAGTKDHLSAHPHSYKRSAARLQILTIVDDAHNVYSSHNVSNNFQPESRQELLVWPADSACLFAGARPPASLTKALS